MQSAPFYVWTVQINRRMLEFCKFSPRIFPGGQLRIGFGTAIAILLIGSEPAPAQFLPPPPPPVPQPASPPPVSEEYILGAGDRIQIDIFNVPEYSGENGRHQVSVDGTLNLPLVGAISVRGMTVNQATEALSQAYGEYLQRPLITLKLLETRPIQVAIAGEVRSPGAYMMSPDAGGPTGPDGGRKLPTVTRVLQMAGGVTSLADIRQVKIRRAAGDNRETVINIDLWALLQTGDLRQDVPLRDGDSIFIPTVTELDRAESRQMSSANFASTADKPINVAVVGEVNRPGTHVLSVEQVEAAAGETAGRGALPLPETVGVFTVTRAIQAAGGITPEADIRAVEVRRISRTGTEQTITVDLWKLLREGDLEQDIALQQGDTIAVPEARSLDAELPSDAATASFAPGQIQVSVVGEVLKPGTITLPPNSSFNQAVLAAGGLQGGADKDEMELIRIAPNGTVSRRTIAIDLSGDVNDANNPVLRNNDVIMVNRSGGAAFRENLGAVLGGLNPLNNVLGFLRFVNILN